jgi:bifunctional DNA-binding transcriptional regulator/antitoxin component of YhaV-PrlF toxin-antitoxin module
MTAVVTKDGQLPLPRELRERLGLAPGHTLEIHIQNGLLLAWKKSADDPFEKWRGRGRLPIGENADEYLRLIRDGAGRVWIRALFNRCSQAGAASPRQRRIWRLG